ncbi:MAG: ABC transporter permease [Citricoccus sp.]|uniref:ABC transporter permease n=1 Tax=Citricoccus nitrophenolicus TaxID=863575 RepID=UPI0039B41059
MTTTDLLINAYRSAFRRPLRALLTIVAVVIGAFTFTITSGLGNGVNAYIDSQTRAVGATDTVQVTKTSPMSFLNERMEEYDESMAESGVAGDAGILNEDDLQTVESRLEPGDEVEASLPVSPLYYSYDGGQRFRFIYNGNWPGKTANLSAGEQLTAETDDPRIIIPQYAVEPLGFPSDEDAVGSTVTVGVLGQDGDVRELEATISGVQVKALIGGNIPFGNQSFGDRLEELSAVGSEGGGDWYAHMLVTGDDPARIVEAVSEAGYTVSTAEQIVGDYKSIVSAVLLLLNILASVAILAALFGIVNTLLMSVQERTRQIGMLRALGMPRSRVFVSIALEALILSTVGAVVAIALGLAVGLGAGPTVLEMAGLDLPGLNLFEFDAVGLAVILVSVLLAALVAALLPAWRAARLEPMDALREVR